MERPFAPRGLSTNLTEKLDAFIQEHDFVNLYKSYSWKNDVYHYRYGFQDIFRLEVRLGQAKTNRIALHDIEEVVQWGCPPNHHRKNRLEIVYWDIFRTLTDNIVDSIIVEEPQEPARILDLSVHGIGPTYVSKVLRFILPVQYGVMDTRLVRVLGNGDPDNRRHEWLSLTAYTSDYEPDEKSKWSIERSGWTEGYGEWINILRYFAQKLPDNCPHPQQFVDAGLRNNGIWTCADVEMALFAYASAVIDGRC